MKIITINSIIIMSLITSLNAQIDLEKITYGNNLIEKLENNVAQYVEIEISKDLETELQNNQNRNSLKINKPIFDFRKLIYELQNVEQEGEISEAAITELNEITQKSIQELCDCEFTREKKLECAKFSKSAKGFALKLQMFEAFKNKNENIYCELYPKYVIALETEYHKYKNHLYPERVSFCGQIPIKSVYWYEKEEDTIMKFIEFDYYMNRGEKKKAFNSMNRILNNNISYFDRNGSLDKLLAERIARYIFEEDVRKRVKNELKSNISNFLNNQEPTKEVLYNYDFTIIDIRITFETFSNNQIMTKEGEQRFKQRIPIKTKIEIINDFKSTEIYKVMTKKKYINKYVSQQ